MANLIFHHNASEPFKQNIYWQDQYTGAQDTIGRLRKELACVTTDFALLKLEHESLKLEFAQKSEEAKLAAKLNKENKKLTKLLNKRTGREEPYKSNTPSSKKINKRNSSKENQAKKGGAQKGHKGYGRNIFSRIEADKIVRIPISENCDCKGEFNSHVS
ncbi:MAG: hypothetical protein L3J71_16370 [Victivallaceae bacterium]|nr:hypothetical protein [Victivallaceae bacterium]